MQDTRFLAEPVDLGIDPQKLDELMARVKQEVDAGLLPAIQVALARHGKLALFESYGDATNDSLFCIFSSTKAITSAAIWLLIQEGTLDITHRVSSLIPEFANNGKAEITVEQVMLHTSGFPHAPFRVTDWPEKDRRLQRFSDWRLNWEPGSRYEYHPTSSMWILAEIIERLGGQSYPEYIRARISEPLGLNDLWVGIPEQYHERITTISHVGEALTPKDYEDMGLPVPPVTEVTPEAIEAFNRYDNRVLPVPGGGGVMSAADLALFYQGLIGNLDAQPWTPETIANVTRPRTGDLVDMITGTPINRALGVVVAGDEKRNHRGFGHTNSARSFGHGGAGGQLGWVDQETGISFSYVTNGHDRNRIRQARRGISISNKAAVCALS
jgi:CubicO group peptidase (beta-lactamase class C family)